jgi:nucleotide-binding universal stress UspA family protein
MGRYMSDIKKILYPTDFSECSERALSYAISLAKMYKAKIDIIHVIHNVADISNEEPFIPFDTIEHEKVTAMSKRLKLFCIEHFKGDVEYKIHISEGVPFKEIIKAARELESDIIVMGTHGYSGLTHLLLGSTAEKVVRESPVPVLTVRRRE